MALQERVDLAFADLNLRMRELADSYNALPRQGQTSTAARLRETAIEVSERADLLRQTADVVAELLGGVI